MSFITHVEIFKHFFFLRAGSTKQLAAALLEEDGVLLAKSVPVQARKHSMNYVQKVMVMMDEKMLMNALFMKTCAKMVVVGIPLGHFLVGAIRDTPLMRMELNAQVFRSQIQLETDLIGFLH